MAITKVTSGVRTLGTGEVTASDIESSLDLSSKTVTLPASSVTAHVSDFDDSGLQDDIAILGFKVAANGSLSKYNLADQTIDDFQDATGVDASASTNGSRDSSGKYYKGAVAGTITQHTASGTHTASSTGTATILLVGGGAGGGFDLGGGGGAGGVRTITQSLTSGTGYTVTIGTGGAGATSHGNHGANGGSTTFDSTTITGGGGASSRNTGGASGTTDGSGGGGSGVNSVSNSGAGGGNYGNAGGSGGPGGAYGGGGGGGAGAAGGNANGLGGTNADGGAGGVGLYFADFAAYGDSGYFGGGGGGSASGGSAGAGGNGGGGVGNMTPGTAGTANTGGGGGGAGGAGGASGYGGAGGSGVVIVKDPDVPGNLTLVSTATTADSAPTSGDLVMTYTNGAGTATVNTDLKAYVSRDSGTTWTQATLSSEGTTGGHTILTAHNVDISSQPSGTSMRYKIETLNQSASKETRIQAVSLGWA